MSKGDEDRSICKFITLNDQSVEVRYSVGVDISKQDFKACFVSSNDQQQNKIRASRTFTNSPAGHDQFLKWVHKNQKEDLPITVVMEATGVYHEHLAWFLYDEQMPLSIVLPNRAKAYIISLGHKSKNDKVDAKGLAIMGAVHNLTLWQPGSKKIYDLRSLTRHVESLQQFRTSLINQLEAFRHSKHQVSLVGKSLRQTLKTIEKQIDTCKKQIEETIKKDSLLNKKVACMISIKGVGIHTAAIVIAETNGFALVTNLKQLTSYAGYDVKENQSGQRTGKTKITKKGNAHIRRAMHLPAFNAVRYKVSPFDDLYQRVFDKTGIKMKGYVAVQAKLLRMLYTLWKTEEMFDINYYQDISREKEVKLSLQVDSERITKEVASDKAEATRGRHPSEKSVEVSLQVS